MNSKLRVLAAINRPFIVFVLILLVISVNFSLAKDTIDPKFELYAVKPVPDNFPKFIVPGFQNDMNEVEKLFNHHYLWNNWATMWDLWIPMSILWAETDKYQEFKTGINKWIEVRQIDREGYVNTHQHIGLAHPQGWPFPLWTQVKGVGWQFDVSDSLWGPELGVYQSMSLDGWVAKGLESKGLVPNKGILLNINEDEATLETPYFEVEAIVSPFFILNWFFEGVDPNKAEFYIEWKTLDNFNYSPDRKICFKPDLNLKTADRIDTAVKAYDVLKKDDVIVQMRLGIKNAKGANITLKKFHTALDTRHQMNNFAFLKGFYDYFIWTGDVDLLKQQMPRMRKALGYAISEFNIEKSKCVHVKWWGHDGRSGVVYKNGKKKLLHGRGLGGTYYDLLPFGERDSYNTLYGYDVLLKMADLERQIKNNPQWNIAGESAFDPDYLEKLAGSIKSNYQKIFWNSKTKRFGSLDADNVLHDYGFICLNLESIYYDMPCPKQNKEIMDWISGKRIIKGDTSVGEDIYHWVFAPRCTTKRNIDYYVSSWFAPESIPWGDQVQDGGAVLAWSYYDLMNRIKVYGPDNAWQRLKEITAWFNQVEKEGGYRAYYSKSGRGNLQGGNIAGGLGLDREFIESILVPQVMIYGFMGLKANAAGIVINPKLPSDWPQLTITNIRYRNFLIDVTVDAKTVKIKVRQGTSDELLKFITSPNRKIEIIS
jgi:hypothetical protein